MQSTTEDRTLNPFPWYRRMRETDPIHFYPEYRAWQVFRYDDVLRVLSDSAAFSSNISGGHERQDPLAASLVTTDPPRHRQLRNLVTQAFTPRSVAALTDRITTIVNDLLDRVVAQGQMDVVDDLAYPLPVIVIAEMLGIPREDRDRFKAWSDAIVGASLGGGKPQAEMSAYFLQMIEQRRQEPRDDLISALLNAQIEGVHLTRRELLGFCVLLLVAGNETTTNLIGNAVLCFDEHPEVMAELRVAPDLIPGAIEEVLRYRSPVQMMYRRVAADVDLDGRPLQAGQMVMAQIGSANRDEAQFPDADRFDIRRAPNRHLAFGHGIHFCLGAPLARLESKIALTLMLDRLPEMHRVRTVALQGLGSPIVYGVKHLPITFHASAA
ncbi:MAG TPA: cytochrome P450 [Chloroflexia bacterium]|nr:cytochrome P450 [Chloroflexia bacterium]